MGKAKKKQQEKSPVNFVAISCWRLYVFSILSFGLYEIYWMYKNWKAVKESSPDVEDQQISPFCRGVLFFPFWIFSLLHKIAERYGKKKITYIVTAALYTVSWFLAFIWYKNVLVGLYAWLIAPLLLMPFQKAINNNNNQREPWNKKEFLVVFSGIVLMVVLPIYVYTSRWATIANMSEQQQTSFFSVSGIIYRYTVIYNEVCTAQGEPLDKYIETFNQKFEEERNIINAIIKKTRMSFNEFMQMMLDEKSRNEGYVSASRDLEELREFFILQKLSDEGKISSEDGTWKEEYNNYMTLQDTCKKINDEPEYVIKLIGIERFLQKYMADI